MMKMLPYRCFGMYCICLQVVTKHTQSCRHTRTKYICVYLYVHLFVFGGNKQ